MCSSSILGTQEIFTTAIFGKTLLGNECLLAYKTESACLDTLDSLNTNGKDVV